MMLVVAALTIVRCNAAISSFWKIGGKAVCLLAVGWQVVVSLSRDSSWFVGPTGGGYFLLLPYFLPRRGREAGGKWAIGEWMVFVPNVRVANEEATWQGTNLRVGRRSRRDGAMGLHPRPRFRGAHFHFSPSLDAGKSGDGWAFWGEKENRTAGEILQSWA